MDSQMYQSFRLKRTFGVTSKLGDAQQADVGDDVPLEHE